MTVVETAVFIRHAGQVWSAEERHAFIDWISEHPDAGDLIPRSGGLRKVRWGRAGLGKQGGARVIYFVKTSRGEVWLLMVYAKSRFDTLPVEVLVQWKDAIDG